MPLLQPSLGPSPHRWSSRRGGYPPHRAWHLPSFWARLPLSAEPSRADFFSSSGAFPQFPFCLTFLSPHPSWLMGQGGVLVSSQSPLMGDRRGREGCSPGHSSVASSFFIQLSWGAHQARGFSWCHLVSAPVCSLSWTLGVDGAGTGPTSSGG